MAPGLTLPQSAIPSITTFIFNWNFTSNTIIFCFFVTLSICVTYPFVWNTTWVYEWVTKNYTTSYFSWVEIICTLRKSPKSLKEVTWLVTNHNVYLLFVDWRDSNEVSILCSVKNSNCVVEKLVSFN